MSVCVCLSVSLVVYLSYVCPFICSTSPESFFFVYIIIFVPRVYTECRMELSLLEGQSMPLSAVAFVCRLQILHFCLVVSN